MALLKSIPTDFGVAATYWHILGIDLNRLDAALRATMAGYIDETARRAGRRPVAVMTLSFTADACPATADGLTYDAIYAAARSVAGEQGGGPPFADAVDA